jgi:cytochrome P450
LQHPYSLQRCLEEIRTAESANHLSTPIQFEETRQHLPYFAACIKESLRLHPPAPNLFARLCPPEGKTIDGVYLPGGTEITSHGYTAHRDKTFFGEDAEEFRPERWLEGGEKRASDMDGGLFYWGMGFRVCIGKDIATMELFKLLPEVSYIEISFVWGDV